jgi:low temperature requirement protein LtrA
VIVLGATLAGVEPTAVALLTAAAGFAVVGALWGAYFAWVHPVAARRLETEADHRERGHLARDLFTLGHIPIVAGAVVFAVGVEEALAHPGEALPAFGWTALAGGLALWGLGAALIRWRAAVPQAARG